MSGKENRIEPGEHEPLPLEVAGEALLAELELVLEVGQQLAEGLVPHAALHHVGDLTKGDQISFFVFTFPRVSTNGGGRSSLISMRSRRAGSNICLLCVSKIH